MRRFESLEEEVIRFAIDHYRGRMSEVARKLGIGRSTLYRKIRDYGIMSEEPFAP
jgi:DNA-binding NtrC family response regulator